ncbi:hypothetical protein Tco_1140503 [Tanacetum coccineum]
MAISSSSSSSSSDNKVRSSDEESTLEIIGLDEHAFRNKTIESKTAETNKTIGTTNEASIVKAKSVNETVMSKSKINRDEVIIEDWTSDDEDDVCAVM